MENVNICIIEDFDAYIQEQGDANVYIKEEEEFESSISQQNFATLLTEESTDSIILDNILKELDKKQDKEDENLNTNIKTVVGAINELHDTIGVSGGGGTKEVIEVENEDALNDIEEPNKEVIYITANTEQLYIYDGKKFINVTNKQVNNTIYTSEEKNLIDSKYSTGLYIVVTGNGKIYNFSVGASGTLRLYDYNGWANTVTGLSGKEWKWHNYIYQEDIDALLPLIYAGL